MADEYFEVKGVRQLIPSSGLWLHIESQKADRPSAEFEPIVAIALVDIVSPSDAHFLTQGMMPVTSGTLMYGLFERTPFLGLIVRYRIYHDADFEELGVRLRPNAKPRAWHIIPAQSEPEQQNDALAAKAARKKGKRAVPQ